MTENKKDMPIFDHPDPRFRYARPPFKEKSSSFSGFSGDMNPPPDYGVDTYKGNAKLNGLVAIITGGDSGIGRAIAIAFAKEGAHLAISFLAESDDTANLKKELNDIGAKFILLPGDLSSSDHCKRIVKDCFEKFNRIDILVNNAAYAKVSTKIEEITDDEWTKHFAINCHAPFYIIKESLKFMKPGSSIINTSSINAKTPMSSLVPYSMTKSAIVNMTVSLADQLIERGIRVNAVLPGLVWTPLILSGAPTGQPINAGARAPIGRPAQPSELAGAYVYLADPGNTYTTGSLLSVHGGFQQI